MVPDRKKRSRKEANKAKKDGYCLKDAQLVKSSWEYKCLKVVSPRKSKERMDLSHYQRKDRRKKTLGRKRRRKECGGLKGIGQRRKKSGRQLREGSKIKVSNAKPMTAKRFGIK